MKLEPTLSVLYSELVLSLYPILIKTVNTNIFSQILSRFLVFPVLALIFGSTHDFTAIWSNPYEAFVSTLHNLLNMSHIASSYISYKNLSVGTAISLFYLYPIFNIIAGALLFNEKLTPIAVVLIIVAFIGTYLIATARHQTPTQDQQNPQDKPNHNYGVIMGIISAITETMIFIFIRSNTDAQASPFYTVNHLYPAGLAMLLLYSISNKKVVDTNPTNWLKLLGFNGLLGFTGYISRFYAIPKISTLVFSLLSFFGVAFGYLWGILFAGDTLNLRAILGGGLIAISTALIRYFEIV